MRQVGILAAAGTYALNNNIDRLKEDHSKAKYFAEKLSKIESVSIDMSTVMTNIVIFGCDKYSKKEIINKAKENGVIISSGSYELMRAVFHLDVSMDETKKAVEILKTIL